jgi:hypothetical protein
MSNKYIGSVDIVFNGKDRTLHPSFRAIIDFEDTTGLSIREALQTLASEKISFKVVVAAIWAGLRGEAYVKNNPSLEMGFDIVGEIIMQEGIKKYILPASTLLGNAWMSSEEIIGKGDGDEGKKQQSAMEQSTE